jgi:hypothetical protein
LRTLKRFFLRVFVFVTRKWINQTFNVNQLNARDAMEELVDGRASRSCQCFRYSAFLSELVGLLTTDLTGHQGIFIAA